MPSINLITTTAGRAAILAAVAGAGTLVVADVKLSDTNQAVGVGTTSLASVVATLTATGSVRAAGAGHSLHVLVKDDSAAAYSVRALALRLTGGTCLMVYSQASLIASKVTGSSLHLALDLTLDADTAATITFGDTDYVLPAAGESAPGIIEIATSSEVGAGSDAVRAVTPLQLSRMLDVAVKQSAEIAALGSLALTLTTANVKCAFGFLRNNVPHVLIGRAATTGQIQQSLDGGQSFTARPFGSSATAGCNSIAYDPVSGVLIAGGDSGEIQRSTNLGVTWSRIVASGGHTLYSFVWSADFGKFFACGGAGDLWWSTNGLAWTGMTAAAGYSSNFKSALAYGGKVFFCGWSGEIQVTSNGTSVSRLVGGGTLPLESIQATPRGIVALSSANSGASSGYLSVDGGASFTLQNFSAEATLSADVQISPSGLVTSEISAALGGGGWFLMQGTNAAPAMCARVPGVQCQKLVRTGVVWVGWSASDVYVSRPIAVPM